MAIRTVTASLQTTDNTQTRLWVDPDGPRRIGGTIEVKAWDIQGGTFGDLMIVRVIFIAGNNAEAGWQTPVLDPEERADTVGANTWDVLVQAATEDDRVEILVTGENSKTIEWRASITMQDDA